MMAVTLASSLAADSWRHAQQASDADPLFLGWEWQQAWWQHCAPALRGAQLHTFIVADDQGQVEAIAPVYSHVARRLPLLATRSLQFVGSAWRDPRVMLSEYLEPIYPAGNPASLEALLAAVRELAWDEFVAALTPRDGDFHRAVRKWCTHHHWYLRELEPCDAHHARLDAGFEAYVKALTPGTRRRLLNNRSRLHAQGDVVLRRCEASELDAGLETLNALHARRFGEPAYGSGRLAFLSTLHASLRSDAKPLVSVLEVGGVAISALYDIRIGARQYNLQMGFDPRFDRSVSPGLLHLGYAMEEAAGAGVRVYDFLGGTGLRTNYKTRISTGTRPMVTLQVVRDPLLAAVYRLRDLARAPMKDQARASDS
jgi:CelD/BcsL family acetyltransferase involved in cellulose biosynthesis